MNSRAPDVAIYLHTYLRASSQRREQFTRAHSALILKEQTRIAATSLAWTTVILNSSETTSGPLSNGRALKMYS